MSEKISEVASNSQFKSDYVRYGIYILYRRVLSDYRDGLKPVQRRIIYAMLKNSKATTSTVKSAAVVGDVMKWYHAHGDCKHGDTVLYTLDHQLIRIEDVYNQGIKELEVLAIDPNTGEVIPAIAKDFRIGQYSTKEYRVHLSNGYVDKSTENHPYLTADLKWVMAKDLKPNTCLCTKSMGFNTSGRACMNGEPIYAIVHDYYNGKPASGFERHHIDHNYINNKHDNLIAISKADHMVEHMNSPEALAGLDAGRYSMFDENGKDRERIRAKNSLLAKSFNKDGAVRHFHHVINMMKEQGMELTEENYESFRGKVYNLPIVSRLLARHPEYGCNSFEDLVNYTPVSLSVLYNENKNTDEEINNDEKCISPFEFYYDGRGVIYKRVFDKMLIQGIPITFENYRKMAPNGGLDNEEKFNYLFSMYKIECPYVEYVEVVDVENTPYYDFTVDGVENMLIPVSTPLNESVQDTLRLKIPFICIHNSSIYMTIKPLANWFETYIPLIDPKGNFGTFQGDPCAASRYTECKLSKFALENVLGDLIDSPEAVDWSPTYNEATKEPDYLPVKVPLLLINGSFGIGLGLRAEIPSHNLVEVIDATLALMDNPDTEIVLVPDHCMPCEIINTDFAKISNAGFGHYKVRGKIDIEQYKGKQALIIKSVPNLTSLNNITDKIEDLIKKKKIIQIDNCFDESTVTDMRYVIVLKAGADPNYVKDVIYKNTGLEQTLRVNFETLNGLNPLRMSYKSYLLSFIDFRKMTKFRVYSNKLQTVQTRIHERDAYIKALESGEIDNVIDIIKKQKKVDDAALIEYLVKKLKITDLQARYIIEADLKKLSYGYLEKYKAEAAELEKVKAELLTHIMDDRVIENDIRQELIDIKTKYGKPRNCTIIADTSNDIPKGEMLIAITEKNYIRKVPGGANIGNFRNDSLRTLIKLDNTDSILIFDEMGKVFKLPVHKVPFTDKNSNGTDIRFLIKSLTANINTIIPESVVKGLAEKGCPNNKHYLVTLTNNGLIKRMDLDDFTAVPPSGILYLKLDQGDFVKDIVIAHSAFNLVVYSDRKAVVMNVNEAPYLKRNTKGSRAMANVDHVDGLCIIHNDCTDIAVITESGKINRVGIVQGLTNTGKGKSGLNLIKLASGDKIASVVAGNANDLIHIKGTESETVIPFADLKVGSSISSGDKIIATRSNKIIRCFVERV